MSFFNIFKNETKSGKGSLGSYVQERYGDELACWVLVDLVRSGFETVGEGAQPMSVVQFLIREIREAKKLGDMASRKFLEEIKNYYGFDFYSRISESNRSGIYGLYANEIMREIFPNSENGELKYRVIKTIIGVEYGIVCKQENGNRLSIVDESSHILTEDLRMKPMVQDAVHELAAMGKLSRILKIVNKVNSL